MKKRGNHRSARTLVAVSVALGLILIASGALASDGRIPVYEATTITASGSYYLTQNVTGSVDVQASEVTLDLNGHAVSVNVNVSSSGGPLTRVRVRDGKVLGTVAVGASQDVTVERVEAAEVTLTSVTNFSVEHVKTGRIYLAGSEGGRIAFSVVGGGIALGLASKNNEVVGNTVTHNGYPGHGIHLSQGSSGNFIHENVVSDNEAWGIKVEASSDGARVTDNQVMKNHEGGIEINGSQACQVKNNTVTQNCQSSPEPVGISLAGATYSEVSGNLVGSNPLSWGIRVSGAPGTVAQNTLSRNTVIANGSTGILVEINSNVLEGNVAIGNASYGISITGSNNILSHNIARGNTAGNYNIGGSGNVQVMYGAIQRVLSNCA